MRKVEFNLVVIAMVVGLTLGPNQTTSAEPPEWVNGRAAVARLSGRLPEVAAANGLTVAELHSHLMTDSSLFVDTGHQLLYVEPTRPSSADDASVAPSSIPLTSESVFALHSVPGAGRVIYLDFDGQMISGTAWNNSTGRKSCYTDPYDSDGDPASFSPTEMAEIVGVWQRVAEDYAAFNVDVTTQEPAAAAITRSGQSDQVYGTRALITNSKTKCAKNKTLYQSVCTGGCGGVAYVGVFDEAAKHSFYQPALIFQNGVGAGQKYVAEAVSHEVGHNLGLNHDGTNSVGYYQGHGSWAPIMGVGYYKAITQWSRGEYAGANNKQDDFAVANANGAPPVVDESAQRPLSGTATGIISSRTDTDDFSITLATDTIVTVTVSPAATSPNLDVGLTLKDPSGTTVASNDPPSGSTSGDVSTGMNATITAALTSGTYQLVIDGVAAGDPLTSGYSDYASVGAYTVELSTT
jgi:hypothetical protein